MDDCYTWSRVDGCNNVLQAWRDEGRGQQVALQQGVAWCAGALCDGDDQFGVQGRFKFVVANAHAHSQEELKVVTLFV